MEEITLYRGIAVDPKDVTGVEERIQLEGLTPAQSRQWSHFEWVGLLTQLLQTLQIAFSNDKRLCAKYRSGGKSERSDVVRPQPNAGFLIAKLQVLLALPSSGCSPLKVAIRKELHVSRIYSDFTQVNQRGWQYLRVQLLGRRIFAITDWHALPQTLRAGNGLRA